MNDDEDVKEPKFNWYCQNCKHQYLKGSEQPCNECLDYPLNYYMDKPIKWERRRKNDGKMLY